MTRWQLFGCTVGGLNTLASKNSILQREPKEILLVEGCGVGTRENNEMFHIYKKYQKWIHPSRYEKVAFSQSTNIPYGLVFFFCWQIFFVFVKGLFGVVGNLNVKELDPGNQKFVRCGECVEDGSENYVQHFNVGLKFAFDKKMLQILMVCLFVFYKIHNNFFFFFFFFLKTGKTAKPHPEQHKSTSEQLLWFKDDS